jgi:hypothetical protein
MKNRIAEVFVLGSLAGLTGCASTVEHEERAAIVDALNDAGYSEVGKITETTMYGPNPDDDYELTAQLTIGSCIGIEVEIVQVNNSWLPAIPESMQSYEEERGQVEPRTEPTPEDFIKDFEC